MKSKISIYIVFVTIFLSSCGNDFLTLTPKDTLIVFRSVKQPKTIRNIQF